MKWNRLVVDSMLSFHLWEMFWFLHSKNVSIAVAKQFDCTLNPTPINEGWQQWLIGGGKVGDALLLDEAMKDFPEDGLDDTVAF